MTAETIAKALGGHRAGASWMARCPVHDDRVPSLSISSGKDDKVLVRCHAGCEQRNVITALVDRGLWDAAGKSAGRFAHRRRNRIAAEPDSDAKARTERWRYGGRRDGSREHPLKPICARAGSTFRLGRPCASTPA
jgi:putative DNA primase/helicase